MPFNEGSVACRLTVGRAVVRLSIGAGGFAEGPITNDVNVSTVGWRVPIGVAA